MGIITNNKYEALVEKDEVEKEVTDNKNKEREEKAKDNRGKMGTK